jgi:DegV family protein with EDD domain
MATRIRIITDSVCDLPPALLQNHAISVVPCFVNFDGKSYADDGVELDRSNFYQRIPHMSDFPKTSAPPPALAERILRDALNDAEHLICIHVPAVFSATFNNVKLGARDLPAERFTFIDSNNLSMGIGLQVLMAAQIAEQTGDVAQVVRAVRAIQKHQRLYAVIARLDFLRRSGRVNPLLASLGSFLQIKPVASVHDSVIEPIARIRTFKKALDFLVEITQKEAPFAQLFILHIQNEAGAEELRQRLGVPSAPIVEVGPTLGTHIGLDSLGVVTLPLAWDKDS